MTSLYHTARRQWRDWAVEYPFHATAPTTIHPTSVPGNHVSVVLEHGIRTWGFETADARDEFIRTTPGARLKRR